MDGRHVGDADSFAVNNESTLVPPFGPRRTPFWAETYAPFLCSLLDILQTVCLYNPSLNHIALGGLDLLVLGDTRHANRPPFLPSEATSLALHFTSS